MSVQIGKRKYKLRKIKHHFSKPYPVDNLNLNTLLIKTKGLKSMADFSDAEGVEQVESLNLTRNKIQVIEGLENFVNLKVLNISANQLIFISGLENLHNLQVLQLFDNQITEIVGLHNLRNLRMLDLHNNQIVEIKGLENCPRLMHINLSGNNIIEIKGLGHLTELKFLSLVRNPIYRWTKDNLGGAYGKEEWSHFKRPQAIVYYCNTGMGIDKKGNLVELKPIKLSMISGSQLQHLKGKKKPTFHQKKTMTKEQLTKEKIGVGKILRKGIVGGGIGSVTSVVKQVKKSFKDSGGMKELARAAKQAKQAINTIKSVLPSSSASITPTQPIGINPLSQSTESSIVCIICGKENTPDSRFCGGCGSPIKAKSSSLSQTTPLEQMADNEDNIKLSPNEIMDSISKLKELYEMGALTKEEFEGKKNELISKL